MDIDLGTGAKGFWNFAQDAPDELALVDPAGQHWTRDELLAEANKLVHGLRAQGLQAGDVVAALLPNCAQYSALNLAVTQAGFFLVPLNWHLVGAEVAYILKDSQAKIFICHSETTSAAKAAIDTLGFPENKVFAINERAGSKSSAIKGMQPYDSLIANQSSAMPENRTVGAVMFYTSGTTGKPKGVKRAVPMVDPDTSAIMYTMLLSLFGIQPLSNNVHYCGSPMYHTAVMNWSTSSLHMGHVLVMHDVWDAEAMLSAVERYSVTTTHVVPTQMVRLQKLPTDIRGKYNVGSMSHMVHTAAPISAEVKAQLIDWWGPCIYEYYAATEGGGAIATPEQWLANKGTVGTPWPGASIKIVDEKGHECKVGEQGTIYLQMNDLTRFEYRGDKKKTEQSQLDGYFTAGDIGYFNDDGFLFLCDRKIDMIISGGVNIYPAEIESELITHTDIIDCCVFGIPDEHWGEQIKAVVELRDGLQISEEELTSQLNEFLSKRVAKMKLPKSYDVIEKMPRDPNGKLYKRRLRAPYWEGRETTI